jgi:hypothetical protein
MRLFAMLRVALVSSLAVAALACDAGEHSASGNTGGASSSSGGAGTTAVSSSSTTTTTTTSGGILGSINCPDSATTAGAVNQQYGGQELTANGGKSYFLQANWWHMFSAETENYNGLSFTVTNPMNASVPQTDNAPMGFPSIFIGTYAGHATAMSNLPKQVSALTAVPTIYKSNSSTVGFGNHNAAYDVWFTQSSAPLGNGQSSPGAGGAYLMVWMFKPTNRQPRGSDYGHGGQTVAGVPGTWDVWIDKSTDPPCTSYVASTPIDGLEFDLNDFIKDAVTKSYGVTSSMYLSIVFGGFEIWGGNDGLALTQFCADVN